MPPADKRARKKENARAAREQREAELKRKRRLRSAITVGIVGVLFIGLIVLISTTGGKKKKTATTTPPTTAVVYPAGCVKTAPPKTTKPTYKSAPPMTIDLTKTYVAHFNTTCGDFDVTLAPKVAPKTVNSFVFLAKNHFYDGLTFHRVAENFVIQGGDPTGTGNGGPGYDLPTEPPKNGYRQGSVAMAKGTATSGSQFFIVLSNTGAQSLGAGPPYQYGDLGDVTKGFEVVQKLGSLFKKGQDPGNPATQVPSVPLYMFKVTITES